MKSLPIALLSGMALFATASLVAAGGHVKNHLSYEQFESSVNHIDLEECPTELAGEDRFCRATIMHDMVHVFAFSENGNQDFVGFQSYDEDEYKIMIHDK